MAAQRVEYQRNPRFKAVDGDESSCLPGTLRRAFCDQKPNALRSVVRRQNRSADLNALHAKQGSQLFQLACNVPDSNRAVMRRPATTPLVHKVPGTKGKSVSAIRVTDFEYRTGRGFALRH